MSAIPPQETARREGLDRYDNRLKKYDSRFNLTFAIELKDGSIKKLGVKEGDKVVFDTEGLKRRAK